jgi:hypothetical protein
VGAKDVGAYEKGRTVVNESMPNDGSALVWAWGGRKHEGLALQY